jgi:hypothetical protein
MLISALETRIPDGAVWKSLVALGMTEEKVLKEWKKKSHFLVGKAELLRKEYKDAGIHLEAALKLIAGDLSRAAEENELRLLLTTATKKRSEELKKEKSTWSKAFEKNKAEAEGTSTIAAASGSTDAAEKAGNFASPVASAETPTKAQKTREAATIDLTKPGLYGDVFKQQAGGKFADKLPIPVEDEDDEGGNKAGNGSSWGVDDSLVGMAALGAIVGVIGLGAYWFAKSRRS